MEMLAGIEARVIWAWLLSRSEGKLAEPAADYSDILERLEASELLVLLSQVQARLSELNAPVNAEPVRLYIDRQYRIRMDCPDGMELHLRPLVKAIFILFLKHPEGILLKERSLFEKELNAIYEVIYPQADPEVRLRRVQRLMDPTDNSFSETTSRLNTDLEKFMPAGLVDGYKVSGTNGHPRRIPLDPLLVVWE